MSDANAHERIAKALIAAVIGEFEEKLRTELIEALKPMCEKIARDVCVNAVAEILPNFNNLTAKNELYISLNGIKLERQK